MTPAQLKALRRRRLRDGERNRLRAARHTAQLTQFDVAMRTGIAQNRISLIERGSYAALPLEVARTIATFFVCPIEDLFPPQASA